MNKAEFMSNLQAARAEWDSLLAQAQAQGDASMLTTSDDMNGWSIKDFVAHNNWYEREILRLLKTRTLLFGPSDRLWAMRNDERNQVIYDMYHDLPLSGVLLEERQVYKDLLVELRRLKDEDFNDPRRFNGMPIDWMPWQLMAENSYEHYRSHLDDIKRQIEAAEESN
jgi:hypothetical protein